MIINRIMTVCTGNICRSPLAEAELRKHLPEKITVCSSGLSAVVGAPASKTVQKLAQERGLDLSGHKGTQITEPMALKSNLILVMTCGHKKELLHRFPTTRGRVFLLGQWGTGEVPDPYGGSESLYKAVDLQIQKAVKQWIAKLAKS
jgi:protein-tyrosine phosphatase